MKKPCSVGCSGHVSHPCEKCGTQWSEEESVAIAQGKHSCEDCGTFEDVDFCIDPYNQDMCGEEIYMHLCKDCHYIRVSDI